MHVTDRSHIIKLICSPFCNVLDPSGFGGSATTPVRWAPLAHVAVNFGGPPQHDYRYSHFPNRAGSSLSGVRAANVSKRSLGGHSTETTNGGRVLEGSDGMHCSPRELSFKSPRPNPLLPEPKSASYPRQGLSMLSKSW